MMLLLRHPDQMRRLRDQRGLLNSAVEEMLRFECPVQRGTFRFAGEEMVLHGQKIEAGQQVSAVIGAANRDPRQFPEPETFDITREPNRHRSFGRGIHFCLGAPLARAEAKIAVGRLLERFPAIDGDVRQPQWRANSGFRGMRELEVALG
jgi:pimeloyl-[acyl-carrier protein] synthase